MWQEANCFCFSFLSTIFTPSNSPLFFNHHFPKGELSIILLFMGTCQSDPLIEPFFILTHFHAFKASFITFASWFFLLLIDGIHILNLVSLIPLAFNHFASQLASEGLVVQPCKCTTWSPSNLFAIFSPPHGFCYLPNGIQVLRVPCGFVLFSSSFFKDTLDEDVCHVDVFIRLGDVHVAFGILFRCFA
jgi:hypothetical protein